MIDFAISLFTTLGKMGAQRRANRAQRRSNAVLQANERYKNILTKRALIKEQRLRRARLLSGAVASGVQGSSGVLGAEAAMGASFGASLGQLQADVLAARGMTKANAARAKAEGQFYQIGAMGDFLSQGVDYFRPN